jgi:hypothetical protein
VLSNDTDSSRANTHQIAQSFIFEENLYCGKLIWHKIWGQLCRRKSFAHIVGQHYRKVLGFATHAVYL